MRTPNKWRDRRQHYTALALLIGLAALLRAYHLNVSALRGDEAFAIRYWAASLPDILKLARLEPHPVGTFVLFSGWKALMGESELAMRWLPLLFSLLGVPAVYGLGRRLLTDRRAGWGAALLYAVNPFLIWHAQDARNYAIWAALSPLALLALIRAFERKTYAAWGTYAVCAVCALYSFFFEPFLVLVGAVWVLIYHPAAFFRFSFRPVPWRSRLRWVLLVLEAGIALIPWVWQAAALAGSGYRGAAGGVILPQLWERFLPALIVGEETPDLFALWPVFAVAVLISLGLLARARRFRLAAFLTLYLLLPVLLVTLASTRMNVFLPRYVIAATPALILLLVALAQSMLTLGVHKPRLVLRPVALVVMLFFIACVLLPLIQTWYSGPHKAPDWRGLRDYLITHVQERDSIVISTADPATGTLDPAFGYYFRHPNSVIPLPLTAQSTDATIRVLALAGGSVWFIPTGPYAAEVDSALREQLQIISDRGAGAGWIVREFRSRTVNPAEIQQKITAGAGSAQLLGYSLDRAADQLTVILFWSAVGIPKQTVTVQLIGVPNPANGSPLWAQDDHPALGLRDVYTLRLGGLPAGTYTLQTALYDPASPAVRIPWRQAGGRDQDTLALTTITIPGSEP